MEESTDIQINVLNNFQVLIPLSGDSDSFVFTQTTLPTLGLTLTRTDTNDSYHYQIQMLQSKGITEEIISNGLVWAKRTPYQFQKNQNTLITEALACRLRIPTGIFDFRRVKQKSIRFVVRCFSNNVLLSTGVSQICNVFPKKRLATEGEADENNNLVIPICWVLDGSDRSESAVCLPQAEQYSSPEDYKDYRDEDSMMENLNNSDSRFQSYSNEGDSDELSQITVSHMNYIVTEPETVVANDPLSQYMVLYNGNAEVVGNFRALNFYKASDINIKEDVRLLSDDRDPRSVLLKIDGVEYKFKDSVRHTTNKRFVGYIAQQIESVVPEAVQLIDGILHVDYESLIPYLSESIKQNFKDITDIKSDTSQIHKVVDVMYAEFVKKEQKSEKSKTVSSSLQSRNRSLRWIIGASLAVLLLISVVIGVFLAMPLVHSAVGNSLPVPNAPTADPSSPTQSSTPISVFPSIDQDLVVELYHATGGSNSWMPKASPSTSICDWPGVACDTNFRVIALELRQVVVGTVGTIPDSIGKLDKLTILQLPLGNDMFGTIPASIGNLKNLIKLDLQRSKFTGSVPLEIFSLPSLETLVLSENKLLSWMIPPQIADMKGLKTFDASSSGLYGTIPDGISGLSDLRFLALGSNNLTGTVPSLANTSVHHLRLENNHFTGPIPKLNEQLFIQQSKDRLQMFVKIANNNFSGEFDLPIVQKNMNYFHFVNNSLTSVASRFGNIDPMTVNLFCFAAGNPFRCPIPEWFQILCKATCL